MKVTKEIQQAMREYMNVKDVKGKDLGDAVGISRSCISKILSTGETRTKSIKDDNWELLEPLIAPYMKSKSKIDFSKSLLKFKAVE